MKAMLMAVSMVLASAVEPSSAWWDDRMGGCIGGIVGSVLGLMGGLIGVLTGTGRGRLVVLVVLRLMALGGVAMGVAAVAALTTGQPYAVWYPLLLPGILATVLGLTLVPVARQRFAALELRKMEAMDKRG